MDAAKSISEDGLIPINKRGYLGCRRDRAWKSMEELPICSMSTNMSKEGRAQSVLRLHASSVSSSPASSASVLLSSSLICYPLRAVSETGHVIQSKDGTAQVIPMHILAAVDDIQCEGHTSLMKDTQLQEASSCNSSRSESGADREHACGGLENKMPEETSAHTDAARAIRQKDGECQEAVSTLSERALDAEDMPTPKGAHSQESSTHISTFLSGVDDTEQPDISTHVSIPSERENCAHDMPHQNDVKIQETFLHLLSPSKQTEENAEQAIQQMKDMVSEEMDTQISTSVREMDSLEHTADDIEHASQIRNMGSQETFASTTSSSQRTSEVRTFLQKNVELQETSTHSSMIELSLHHHLQLDGAADKEEAAMRSFIMHRFLPAAKEVAAEHESSIASLSSRGSQSHIVPSHSFPPQSQKASATHRIKSRAHYIPKGFTSSRPLHSRHQEDGMPNSMRSCGFFCLGLKTALFRAHRTVSASARSASRKKSWAPNSFNQMKVADEGSAEMEGPLACKKGAVGGVCVQESPRRHAIKFNDRYSRKCCQCSDGCTNAACNAPSSQLGDLVANMAIKEQENGTVGESVLPCIEKQTCDWAEQHVENVPPHELVGENDRVDASGLETSGGKPKPTNDHAFKSAGRDGDDDEDDGPLFFDALSRLNSVKSNASFYTFGSPRSECVVLGSQGEWINDEGVFTDVSSHFETPHASVSENKLGGLSHVCTTNEQVSSPKISSLSKRVGKGLKLETGRKQEKSPSKQDPCACEEKHECQRTESFSGLWHPSLDSMSGLYSSKGSAITPVFPAKCQSNTPNALGWPFGISSYHSSRVEGSPCQIQQEKSMEKYVVGGNVPSPPLPPTPTESWLGKAITKKASTTSPLTTLQQKEKVALARKKLDFIMANRDAENHDAERWEDVVKGSHVHPGHLRFSEELHHYHPSNLNAIKPLKL